MSTVICKRCGESKPALPRAPFKNDIGERVLIHICADCWKDWLTHHILKVDKAYVEHFRAHGVS